MTAFHRVILVAVLVLDAIPATANAQNVSVDSLLRRIEVLERKNAELEQRVLQLEVILKTQSSRTVAVPPPPLARDLQNWRRLRRGMRADEVRALLGEPERIQGGYLAFWHWGQASVGFVDDKVDSWREPER